MAHIWAPAKKVRSLLLVVTVLFAGGVLLFAGDELSEDARAVAAQRTATGEAQFVSFQSFETQEMCPLPGQQALPYARSAFMAGGQQGGGEQVAPPSPPADPATQLDRAPLRYIKDPYPAWSAIAIHPETGMLVATDENLHRVVEYDRLDNTPEGVEATEPRRVIGGVNTHTEMMCGVYIDPKTLEVYVTQNDTVNWLPVFSREARGNVEPDRRLATPHRTFGVTADELRQELYVTIQSPAAVIVYPKTAEGDSEPLRFLEGDATLLADPHGIAVDTMNDLIVVANHGNRGFYGGPAVSSWAGTWQEWIARNGFPVQTGLRSLPRSHDRDLGGRFELPSINIYQRGVSGNTPPLRVIQGPRTRLNWPSHVGLHEERGEIFVANDADDSILVFRLSDDGDVAPTRLIRGPQTGLSNPTGVAVDRVNNEVWASSMGNYKLTAYPITADGDVAPLRTIRGGPDGLTGQMIGNPGAVGYDTKRQEILVPN